MRYALQKNIKTYLRKDAKHDIIAGLVVSAVAIPELMGIAVIAGVPIEMGLYSALLAPIVFAIFGSSKRLIIGADSATAVLLASAAISVAAAGTPQYVSTVIIVSLLASIILALITILKLNFLSDLISRPVMVGFLAGVGAQLMLTKLPDMLGITLHGSIRQVFAAIPEQITHINGMSATIAILVVGVILIFRRSRVPGPLIALAAAIILALCIDLTHMGVALVGAIPGGLPQLTLPNLTIETIVTLLPIAFSVAIVILAQSTAVIRTHATEHDDPIDLPRDMLALSFSGVVSSLTHGFAINGSPPRTAIADIAGMRTQGTAVVMSLLVWLIVLFGGSIFAYLPAPALAAIVFAMGLHLIRARELQYILQTHKVEFFIALAALFGVVFLGVFGGVVLAVVLSLMERLRREYHPRDEILLRDGKLSDWARERVGEVSQIPEDMIVYSFDGPLFFENSNYFIHRLKRAVKGAQHDVRSMIVDAGAIDSIDYTAVEQLKSLYRLLSVDGIRLGFAHISPGLLREFERYGVTDLVGHANIMPTLRAAILYEVPHNRTAIDRVKALKLPLDQVIIVGGGVMETLNLRDTTDVDLVVSDTLYEKYRRKADWNEYLAPTGKTILTHNGINLMRRWIGRSFDSLKRGATKQQGVMLMSVTDLIACKQNLGRRKDMSDIQMLEAYQRRVKS